MSKANRERRQARRLGSQPGATAQVIVTESFVNGKRQVRISASLLTMGTVQRLLADALKAAEARIAAEQEKKLEKAAA